MLGEIITNLTPFGEEFKQIFSGFDFPGFVGDMFGKARDGARGIFNLNYLFIMANVCVSNQFLTWILSLGNEVEIAGPDEVVIKMKDMLSERTEVYGL